MKPFWSGVFPAITTQMHKDGSLDLDATAGHAEALIKSAVTGMIFLGSLGENQPMTDGEKRRVIEAMVKVVNGRVPVLSGVAETSTAEAIRVAASRPVKAFVPVQIRLVSSSVVEHVFPVRLLSVVFSAGRRLWVLGTVGWRFESAPSPR